jgi:hypothetical protein
MQIRRNLAVSETGFIFDPDTGESYTTNETGQEIIRLLKKGKTDEEIKTYFLNEFDVDKDVFEKNYFDFLNMLENLNLSSSD